MDVDGQLPSEDPCIATDVGKCRRIVDEDFLSLLVRYHLEVDVVVNPVGENRRLHRQPSRRVVESEVSLETLFRFEVVVAHLIPERSLMLTFGSELADVRCSESPREVHPEVGVFRYVVDGTDASSESAEVLGEIGEPLLPFLSEGFSVEVSVVEPESSAHAPLSEGFVGGGKESEVEQVVVGHEELLSFVSVGLPHAVDARCDAPSLEFGGEVMNIVVDGVERHVELSLVGFGHIFKFFPHILLVGDVGFELSRSDEEGVVGDGFVVIDLLARHHPCIGCGTIIYRLIRLSSIIDRHDELTRFLIAFSFHDSRVDVVIGEVEMGMSPMAVESEHSRCCMFLEPGVEHPSVVMVLIVVRHLVAVAGIPHESLVVATEIEGIVEQSVVGLVFGIDVSLHPAVLAARRAVHHEDSRQCVGAIDEACRSFENLHGMHVVGIDFHSVLIAELLSLLPDAVVDHRHAVVA